MKNNSLAELKKAAKKPSSLIKLAVADIKACAADPSYKVDMRSWHEPYNGKCHVCFAGAVLAQHTPVTPNYTETPNSVFGFTGLYPDDALNRRVRGLNSLRVGHLMEFINWGWYFTATEKRRKNVLTKIQKAFPKVTGWSTNKKLYPVISAPRSKAQIAAFCKNMLGVARRLEKVGL